MSQAVASNQEVRERALALRQRVNVGHVLRLFTNDVTPAPALLLSAFTEAGFPGYVRIDLAQQFTPPVKIIDGKFQIETPLLTFTCTGATSETVFGWLIVWDEHLMFSLRLNTPVMMGPGVSVAGVIQLQEWALSITA